MCSDHDLGGNNIAATTVAPFAADAFAAFNPERQGGGRCGALRLGVVRRRTRVLLVWTEGVLYRSALDNPNAPGNTKLGPAQKAWLLDLIAKTRRSSRHRE